MTGGSKFWEARHSNTSKILTHGCILQLVSRWVLLHQDHFWFVYPKREHVQIFAKWSLTLWRTTRRSAVSFLFFFLSLSSCSDAVGLITWNTIHNSGYVQHPFGLLTLSLCKWNMHSPVLGTLLFSRHNKPVTQTRSLQRFHLSDPTYSDGLPPSLSSVTFQSLIFFMINSLLLLSGSP